MPPFGVIRGDRVPDAMMVLQKPVMVRTPVMRIPLWLMGAWWCVKLLGRLVALLARLWWATAPAILLTGLWARFGWQAPALTVPVVGVALVAWWALHGDSFDRYAWWPVLGRRRRWFYRRRWWSAMATAGLLVSFNGNELLPKLVRVRCRGAADVLLVRMVTGQIPEDFAEQADRFVHTFGVTSVRVQPHRRPGRIVVTMLRRDPLVQVVKPLPVTAIPDFAALPMGVCEDGTPYLLRLFGTQVLVAGATGAGKGSVLWSFVRALAGGVTSGVVQLWGFDPKGGMELGPGLPLFAHLACDDFQAMAGLLDKAVSIARTRAARLRGLTRQHTPTPDDPLIVLVVDELAALTAYLADRKLKERIRMALSVLLSQGRAVGVHVLAAIQDPRKEVLPFRDLFPTRIGLRLTESSQVDLVLGDGARDRGALCDRIPQHQPGVGYVVLDGDPTPVRVRFTYLTDDDIRITADTYGRVRVIDGHATTATVDAQAPASPVPSRPARKPSPRPARARRDGADSRVPVWKEVA